MKLQPMVHVDDLSSSVAFYEALGASVTAGSADGDFVVLHIGDSELSLLAHPPNPDQGEGAVELNFETDDLDTVHRDLLARGVTDVDAPIDTDFGRQLQVRAPGGMLIKVNEFGPNL